MKQTCLTSWGPIHEPFYNPSSITCDLCPAQESVGRPPTSAAGTPARYKFPVFVIIRVRRRAAKIGVLAASALSRLPPRLNRPERYANVDSISAEAPARTG